jgi:succinyl-diaminopimelate desuccinylase
MADPLVARLHAWLAERETNLLEDYRALLRFPTIEGDPAPNAPFGRANRDALDFCLGLAQRSGMATKDLEGYIGFAEFGSGDRLIMALGHIDVVPVGPGWKHDPFGAEIDGDYVYARGAVDDKGPTIAAFYAARAIQACAADLGCRVRIVFGCNEESGFRCIERYVRTEEAPTYGVAPDSGWPLYNAEKGIANLIVEVRSIGETMRLVRLQGGQRANIVIDRCEAEVEVDPSARPEVEAALADAWDKNLEWRWDGDRLRVTAHGKAAHGSTPFDGDSAAVRALRLLKEIAPVTDQSAYQDLFQTTHIAGSGLGIQGADQPSKDLTCNLGVAITAGDAVRLTFNVRYPVTWSGAELFERCRAHLATLNGSYTLAETTDSPPLYFPIDHPLVRTICDVYREETGEDRKPGSMGGGTYARAIANTVSIGTGWDGDGRAHETDERLKIAHLYKMSRIYAHILYRLCFA